MMDGFGRICSVQEGNWLTKRMVVYLANVIRPHTVKNKDKLVGYDYIGFETRRGMLNNFLVPLEIVYRNGAPQGSSLFKKVAAAKQKGDEQYIRSLLERTGLDSIDQLVPGVMFPKPTYDFSTKLEETGDRALTDEEAFKISGLKREDFDAMLKARDVARRVVGGLCEKAGFRDYDGKVEFVYMNRPLLCDVLGTFDENRFMVDGVQLSKEVLRQWYKKHQPEWVAEVDEAKATKREDWQSLCKVQPRPLPEEVVQLISDMYKTGAQCYVKRNLFGPGFYDLEDIVKRVKHFSETGEVLPKRAHEEPCGGENS
jgi:phosphoribosylaminoimidazole-succinocarboxamide synthase